MTERAVSAKVVACRGMGARTCAKSVPDHTKVMAPGFCFYFEKARIELPFHPS